MTNGTGMKATTVDTAVLAVLSGATVHGNAVRLNGQLERKLYGRTDRVLKAIGGTWKRGEAAHVFAQDPTDLLEQIILTGAVAAAPSLSFFPTPQPLVARMLELVQPGPGMRVLEPSAGRGALALAAAQRGALVDCVELDPAHADYLRTQLWRERVRQADFLSVQPERIYDAVLMNPPFERQADIRHVLHALEFLKPGGRLAAVMSAGVLFRQTGLAEQFRDLLEVRGAQVWENPPGTFRSAGTSVLSVVVYVPPLGETQTA
ncbi:MAG TPA: methyltransferase [Nevskia sp.]|nr:methyltransferase [Nevskia sp.]